MSIARKILREAVDEENIAALENKWYELYTLWHNGTITSEQKRVMDFCEDELEEMGIIVSLTKYQTLVAKKLMDMFDEREIKMAGLSWQQVIKDLSDDELDIPTIQFLFEKGFTVEQAYDTLKQPYKALIREFLQSF